MGHCLVKSVVTFFVDPFCLYTWTFSPITTLVPRSRLLPSIQRASNSCSFLPSSEKDAISFKKNIKYTYLGWVYKNFSTIECKLKECYVKGEVSTKLPALPERTEGSWQDPHCLQNQWDRSPPPRSGVDPPLFSVSSVGWLLASCFCK